MYLTRDTQMHNKRCPMSDFVQFGTRCSSKQAAIFKIAVQRQTIEPPSAPRAIPRTDRERESYATR